MDTRSGSYIDYLVSIAHDIFIMFDNYDRISEIHELPEIVEKKTAITRMESDGWFIENIGNSLESRTHLCCQTNPL